MVRLLGIGDNTVDIYLSEGMQYPGGNAVNVAVQARWCGARASYLGCVGHDALGDLVFDSLVAEDVDVSHVRRIDGPNPRSRIRHEGADRVFIGSNPGVRSRYDLTAEDDAFIAAHTVVHTSVHSDLDGAIGRLRATAKLLSYDFSEHWERPGPTASLPQVDIAFLSTARLSDAACEMLLRWAAAQGPEIVVATRGAAGAAAFHRGQMIWMPAHPVDAPDGVVDTLGAGDGFIAGFLVAHAEGLAPSACLACGAEQAARVCATKGGFGHGIPIEPSQPGLDPAFIVNRPGAAAPEPSIQQKEAET